MAGPEDLSLVTASVAEFEDDFRVFEVGQIIMDRLALVAANVNSYLYLLQEEIDAAPFSVAEKAVEQDRLLRNVDSLSDDADSADLRRMIDPFRAGACALRDMDGLLRRYPSQVPDIFEGYARISNDPGWSIDFLDTRIVGFGYDQEPTILRALARETQRRSAA
jgi:hypothetical protein